MAHAYTLFAESYKRGNPEQRGQFNLGEKMVLAVCESASISTTKGTVVFDPDEGRIEKPRQKRERGSVFQGRIKMTREEYPQVCDYLRSLLLPENVAVTFNGDRLLPRKPLRTFEASLETLVADDQGVMRPRVRKTQVGIYEALPGEVPSLYEMGLPVVETGDKWHVNVGQKVPLNRDRDNVKPAYLQAVRVAVLNAAYDLLTTRRGGHRRLVQAGRRRPALLRRGHQASGPAAVRGEGRRPRPERHRGDEAFPVRRAAPSWSACRKGEWANVQRAGAVLPAGQICPTAKPYSADPNAEPRHRHPRREVDRGHEEHRRLRPVPGRRS